MGFKINLLFILVIFNMFSVVYLCSSQKKELPPSFLEKNAQEMGIKRCGFKYDPGPCFWKLMYIENQFQRRYWYNVKTRNCELFEFGGCGGNPNNFENYGECMSTCSEKYVNYLLNNISHLQTLDKLDKIDQNYANFTPSSGVSWG